MKDDTSHGENQGTDRHHNCNIFLTEIPKSGSCFRIIFPLNSSAKDGPEFDFSRVQNFNRLDMPCRNVMFAIFFIRKSRVGVMEIGARIISNDIPSQRD